MLTAVRKGHNEAAEAMVPWFFKNMPSYYFQTHTRDDQIRHLQAVISSRLSGHQETVLLKSSDGTELTYITPGKWVKELLAVLDQFCETRVQTLRVMSSLDGQLRLSDVQLAPQPRADVSGSAFRRAMRAVRESGELAPDELKLFRSFLASASRDYVAKFEINRAVRHFRSFERVRDCEDVEVTLEPGFQPGIERICVNMSSPPTFGLLAHVVRIFARQAMHIDRAYVDLFEDGEKTTFLSTYYVNCERGCLTHQSPDWLRVRDDLTTVKWLAPHGLDAFCEENGWTMRGVEFLQAACEFAHQFLIKKDLYAFTSDNIIRAVLNNRDIAEKLGDYFQARFRPDVEDREKVTAEAEDILLQAIGGIPVQPVRTIFRTMHAFVLHTLRTNYYLEKRYGLSFRLDPAFLEEPILGEMPYGIYYFHGPSCVGFHVRFRDTARGGMRLVKTPSQARFEVESNRLFDEVAALARTQQDKNKDIPEGGAKAVVLLGPHGDPDLAVKSVVNSMLDLILTEGDECVLPRIVDYLGKREVIYLGPDENITPEHINWIVDRAALRGYGWPASFMSSKPKTGINHKEYGVTSLGVIVFTEELLKFMGIDPFTQPFTVKFTGGPRGDVASNAMKFLFENYGENAKVLCATDGHGAAYDPEGLSHDELMRLIKAEKSISHFDPAKLSGKSAFVIEADTPENAKIRNELHNKVVADVFIPAGGRPDTINGSNWGQYLTPEGVPSSRAIVEGANIFISNPARAKLEENGVLCIQGSSANKTGVICSSYEILAGLTLSDEEFRMAKPRYVSEVLEILKVRARDEARLLLREYKLAGGRRTITDISLSVSQEINSVADRIIEFLAEEPEAVRTDQGLRELILSYCPRVLSEKYEERIFTRVPVGHLMALVAHFIAARIVYHEGLEWVSDLASAMGMREVVKAYLEEEKKVAAMCRSLSRSKLADRQELSRIVGSFGRKYLTLKRLGME